MKKSVTDLDKINTLIVLFFTFLYYFCRKLLNFTHIYTV